MLTGFTFKQKVFEGLWTERGGFLAINGSPIALLLEADSHHRNHSAIPGVHPGRQEISPY
jgi:hypothetical protein